MPVLDCRPATLKDLDALLPVVRQFYVHFDFAWDEARKQTLLAEFIAHPERGQLWLVTRDGQVAGYALIPFYFSLEFDGWVALLDELFMLPDCRGSGAGRRLLTKLIPALAQASVRVVRLEIDRRHPEAADWYAREGFVADNRETWTKRLG